MGCRRWWRCQNRRAAGRSCRQSHRRRPYLAAVGTDAAQADMGGDEPLGAPRAVGLAGAVAKRFQGWRGSRPRHRDLAADQAAGAGAIRHSSSQCVTLGRRRWRWRRGAPDDARWREGRPLRVGQAAQHEQGEEPGQGASAADSKVVHLWRCGWSGRRPRSVLGGSAGRWRLWSLLGWRLPSRRFCPASPAWVFQRGLPWMRGRSDREEERVT